MADGRGVPEGIGAHDGVEHWRCGVDQRLLEPVLDAPDVQQCPTCGHRTDEPGNGVLDDGFDVVAEQWGLLGDPLAWSGMRDAVSATSTPMDADSVRAAYSDAFEQVTGVDIDETADARVHVPHLDHGGMSGGFVDLSWWRSSGLPLLTARAIARRPAEAVARAGDDPQPQAPRRESLLIRILAPLILLTIPLATVGGGGFLLYQRAFGTEVRATVLECDFSGGIVVGASTATDSCTASWTQDGKVVIGPFSGGNGESDVGKTVNASVRGGTAYSESLVLPIVLLALGLPFLAIVLFPVWKRRRTLMGSS